MVRCGTVQLSETITPYFVCFHQKAQPGGSDCKDLLMGPIYLVEMRDNPPLCDSKSCAAGVRVPVPLRK